MSQAHTVELLLVNAFTTQEGEGGNAAAIVLDADTLTARDKLAIAEAAGLSETAFVSRSDTASIKLDFFTPRRQIAHCGHATIATFGYLGMAGVLQDGAHTKETIDGLRGVEVAGAYASMEQIAPRYAPVDETRVLAALGLTPNLVDPAFAPERVDTGNGFIVVGVCSREILSALVCDFAALETLSDTYDLVGFYVFTTDTDAEGDVATARMFAPRYGIEEEAATGMAAGPLACFLYRQGAAGLRMSIEQGRFMSPPSPSRLDVQLESDRGAITRLKVGGSARFVGSTSITLTRA